nr:hypothetical protein CFP56_04019 [Quercus suber]
MNDNHLAMLPGRASMDLSDSSPDPLTLPSSPLGGQRRLRVSSTKPLLRSSPTKSPSRSFIMDTGEAGDASPWRIKVTVEAEPKAQNSPSKGVARTTSVPVKGLRSSSPAKDIRSNRVNEESSRKKPTRKRKGTPMKRPAKRHSPEPLIEEEDEEVLSSPSKYSGILEVNKRGLHKMPTMRSQRLSQAREELDQALAAAVGHSTSRVPRSLPSPSVYEAPGDLTVSMNEDMTMVSVHSLDSYKKSAVKVVKGHTGEKSGVTKSYMPSSPPAQVQYPDLTYDMEVLENINMDTYDPMSWKPTTLAKNHAAISKVDSGQHTLSLVHDLSRQRRERNSTNPQLEEDSANPTVIVADGGSQDNENATAAMDNPGEVAMDEDIWQEASRSLDDTEQLSGSSVPTRQANPTPNFDQLFAGQPLKPPRGKIPKTWRRSSGVEFSYVDSPAPPKEAQIDDRRNSADFDKADQDVSAQRAERPHRPSEAETDTGDRSSGVLTPPSTDEEIKKVRYQADASELTEPDAAATQLQHSRVEKRPPALQEQELSDDSNLNTSASGLFWSRHTQATRPRYQRSLAPRAPDLSDLFDFGSSSPRKPTISPQQPRDAVAVQSSRRIVSPRVHSSTKEAELSSFAEASFQSKASDERQLLAESSSTKRPAQPANQRKRSAKENPSVPTLDTALEDEGTDESDMEQDDESQTSDVEIHDDVFIDENFRSPDHHPMPSHRMFVDNADALSAGESGSAMAEVDDNDEIMLSYEEQLNLDSPLKVQVKFNDSSTASSLLASTMAFIPIDAHNKTSPSKPPTATEGKKQVPTSSVIAKAKITLPQLQNFPAPGFLSRISSTLWSSLLPSGPTFIEPTAPYPTSLRAIIRERYSVVRNVFPWTMIHMRTLHRMLNSCTSGKWDSVVPRPGSTAPIPSILYPLIGTAVKSHNSGPFDFSHQHAHVVAAFMQLLVPRDVIEAMERGEIEWLGDSDMARYRGTDPLGRHGNDVLWPKITGETWWSKAGRIDEIFVAKALMDCAYDNVLICKERGWTNPGLGR